MKKNIKFLGFSLFFLGLFLPYFCITSKEIQQLENHKKIEKKIEEKNYFSILEIPKISLKQEIFAVNQEENNVDKNIFLHSSSTFPDQEKSNIILAAHSGYGRNAYFQKLYKVNLQDTVLLYYQDTIYEYIIEEIETQEKTGTLYLKEDYPKMITLITCTYQDNQTQTIYYGELKSVKKVSNLSKF